MPGADVCGSSDAPHTHRAQRDNLYVATMASTVVATVKEPSLSRLGYELVRQRNPGVWRPSWICC
jgi:hypothetical protein